MKDPAIFISYGHEDAAWCTALADALRQMDRDVWYDEHLTVGASWLATIEHELQSRPIFILILTPEAWASDWVQREFQLALITNRHLIPLMHKPTSISGFLLTLEWSDVVGWEAPAAAQHVLSLLSAQPPMPTVQPTSAAPLTIAAQARSLVTMPASPLARARLFIWSITQAFPHYVMPITSVPFTKRREKPAACSRGEDSAVALRRPP